MGFLAPFLAMSIALPVARCADVISHDLPLGGRPRGVLAGAAVPLLAGFAALQVGAWPAFTAVILGATARPAAEIFNRRYRAQVVTGCGLRV